jgi:hypothetical protein
VLVTLVFTMWGLTRRNFKISMLLLAATLALALGCSVRNELERARLRHAHRLAAEPHLHRSRDDLMRLAPADILTSPIFSLLGIDE